MEQKGRGDSCVSSARRGGVTVLFPYTKISCINECFVCERLYAETRCIIETPNGRSRVRLIHRRTACSRMSKKRWEFKGDLMEWSVNFYFGDWNYFLILKTTAEQSVDDMWTINKLLHHFQMKNTAKAIPLWQTLRLCHRICCSTQDAQHVQTTIMQCIILVLPFMSHGINTSRPSKPPNPANKVSSSHQIPHHSILLLRCGAKPRQVHSVPSPCSRRNSFPGH